MDLTRAYPDNKTRLMQAGGRPYGKYGQKPSVPRECICICAPAVISTDELTVGRQIAIALAKERENEGETAR